MGNVPGNPIDEAKQQEIKRITERVLTAFTKYYALSFKEVMIEEAKKKRKNEAKAAALEAKKKAKEAKPRRERKKKDKPKKLSAKILYTMTLDSDIDPYIVYAIQAQAGSETVVSYKRYKQMKSASGKFKVKGVEFPKPHSKFGGRNLDPEFVEQRREKLGKYLQACVEDEKISQDKNFHAWLGLGKAKDYVWQETFDRAYYKTRCYLWQWRRVIYDSEEEAISRLIVEEIKTSMWDDIRGKLPNNHTVRKKVLQAVFKSINASVTPPVTAAWAGCRKAAEAVKPNIEKTVGEALDKMLEVEDGVKAKLSEALSTALQPVVGVLKEVVGGIVAAVLPKLTAVVFEFFSEEKRTRLLKELEVALQTEDEGKLKTIADEVTDTRKEIYKKIDEELQKALEPVLGPIKAKVSIKELMKMFSPLDQLNKLIKHLFDFFDPDNQFIVVKRMFYWKKKLKESPPADVEKILDEEEWDIPYWYIWRSDCNLSWEGWRVGHHLYDLLYPDGIEAWDLWYHYVGDIRKVNKHALKKLSWKFGDYLSHKAKTTPADQWAAAPDAWAKAVDECFLIGYERSMKTLQKHMWITTAKYTKKLVRKLVFNDIQKMILEGSKAVIEPIQALIIAPMDQLLDLEKLVVDVIKGVLGDALNEIVGSIHPNIKRGLEAGKLPSGALAITHGKSEKTEAHGKSEVAAPAPAVESKHHEEPKPAEVKPAEPEHKMQDHEPVVVGAPTSTAGEPATVTN